LQQPIEGMARRLEEFGRSQTGAIGQGLQDQMAAFAAKLDEILGGQVGQARQLQVETLRALETAVEAFQNMARSIGTAGETATSTMAEQMRRTLDEMSGRQVQMNDAMRALVDEMRGSIDRSQTDTQQRLSELLQGLGEHVSGVIGSLQQQADATGKATLAHQQQFSEEARRSIEALTGAVRSQTQAIAEATVAMRGAIADVFKNSGVLSADLSQTAAELRISSEEVSKVVGDYRQARETFGAVVSTLREIVATAQREASITADVIGRIEAAAQRLQKAQGEADSYLNRLNQVLADAHTSFSSQMLNTVKATNREFDEHLTQSTKLLAGAVADLGETLDQFQPGRAGGVR
jgi:hypothetical protein